MQTVSAPVRTLPEALDFTLPDELAAHAPPEAAGRARDDVRLMVSYADESGITHTRFRQFPDYLDAGDVLVVNTSATINAALDGYLERADGSREPIRVHLSTPISNHRWVIELRCFTSRGTAPYLRGEAGDRVRLAAGAALTLQAPYVQRDGQSNLPVRLWVAHFAVPSSVLAFAAEHGSPIRYAYVPERWPLQYYQTVFATEPGSAEMPSAARGFTHEMVRRLEAKGVRIAPIVLHAGVASLETDEPPYPERFRVDPGSAEIINRARHAGSRIVAVGTTAVRALETVTSRNGQVQAASGWTDLVITPERGVFAVDALLTGLHAPKASHLAMLEAIAGREQLTRAYDAALRHGYLWHEFGDLHLLGTGSGSGPRPAT